MTPGTLLSRRQGRPSPYLRWESLLVLGAARGPNKGILCEFVGPAPDRCWDSLQGETVVMSVEEMDREYIENESRQLQIPGVEAR
jgi:hypothetical protein